MIAVRLNGYRYQRALVGFGGHPTFWWQHFLKKGFYHCLVALGEGKNWILLDPLAQCLDVLVLHDTQLKEYLTLRGYQVIETVVQEPRAHALRIRPFTCVETVCRILGLSEAFILTPYQLFKHLIKK